MKFYSDRCSILNLGLKNCICTGYERCDLAAVSVKSSWGFSWSQVSYEPTMWCSFFSPAKTILGCIRSMCADQTTSGVLCSSRTTTFYEHRQSWVYPEDSDQDWAEIHVSWARTEWQNWEDGVFALASAKPWKVRFPCYSPALMTSLTFPTRLRVCCKRVEALCY